MADAPLTVPNMRSPDCWCESCDSATNQGWRSRMSVCPQCGDKRCPRAKHHDNECTTHKDAPPAQQIQQAVAPAVYRAINLLLAHIGHEGSVAADHQLVWDTMTALKAVDGGVYSA